MISGGLTAAYKELVPQFERTTGNTVVTAYGPSMGTTESALPVRLARGEAADVLIMVGDALGLMIEQGRADAASRVDLVRSPIGMVVRAGAPKPDISTPDALKKTLLSAKSVAYSDSASGVYVGTELFKRLGVADEMKTKAKMISAEPVAGVVARGEAELGFQQISELLPIPGADLSWSASRGSTEDYDILRWHDDKRKASGRRQSPDCILGLIRGSSDTNKSGA